MWEPFKRIAFIMCFPPPLSSTILLQIEEGDAANVWLTNICHPSSFFLQQYNLTEVCSEHQIDKNKGT